MDFLTLIYHNLLLEVVCFVVLLWGIPLLSLLKSILIVCKGHQLHIVFKLIFDRLLLLLRVDRWLLNSLWNIFSFVLTHFSLQLRQAGKR